MSPGERSNTVAPVLLEVKESEASNMMTGFTNAEVASELGKCGFSGVVGESLMKSGLNREWEKTCFRKDRQLLRNSTVKRSREGRLGDSVV